MKITQFAYVAMFCFALVFTSCEKDEDQETETQFNFSAEDNLRAAQADNATDGALNIVENGYVEAEEGRSQINSFFNECAIITIQPNGNGGSIVIDFGEGCQLNNSSIVSGIINMDYGAIVGGTRTINYQFENFIYNSNSVTGGGEILREIANNNGNPQSTINESIVIGFPNTSVTATRTGLRVAEWVAGVGSGTWQDNVYNITGNWDTQLTNGFNRSGLVTEKLVRKLSCSYLVSGLLEVTQNNFTGVINWGAGECDNLATLEVNGQVYDIVL
ncbi:hypothetical protein ULMS_25540 [Patiriisocius marinistellae]|uniref:Uncharacterized protein n=1 Tax=Patiriisocius marinistellae TaxID=2494560 RepID=A0A5J4G2R5_9FLAO|nr:hypothetical protein [Patiriisocius marinistellae]GEQ87046.1 hypothetical protein ULMS_25540 [Patiriisocius marinistellae]